METYTEIFNEIMAEVRRYFAEGILSSIMVDR